MIVDLTKVAIAIPFSGILPSSASRGVCGIYVIENSQSGMSYIGSSRNVYKRFHQHRGGLRKKQHSNLKLQAAYNKYGEEAFIFVIAEICDPSVVSSVEDAWLGAHYEGGALYNLHMTATYEGNTFSPETRKKISDGLKARWSVPGARESIARKLKGSANGARPFRVIDPSGKLRVGHNLAKLCRENGLSNGQMVDMLKGRRRHCKGWTSPDFDIAPRKLVIEPHQASDIRRLFMSGKTQKEIGVIYGVSRGTIARITQGKRFIEFK